MFWHKSDSIAEANAKDQMLQDHEDALAELGDLAAETADGLAEIGDLVSDHENALAELGELVAG